MQKTVKIIKTLPHLIPWQIQQENTYLYATTYTPQIHKYLLKLKAFGKGHAQAQMIKALTESAFAKVGNPGQAGEFSVKGESISAWPHGYPNPIRAVYDFETCVDLYHYDPITGRKVSELAQFIVSEEGLPAEDHKFLAVNEDISVNSNSTIFVTSKPQIPEGLEFDYEEFDYTYPQLFWSRFDLLEHELERFKSAGYRIYLITRHLDSLSKGLVDYIGDAESLKLPDYLAGGFVSAKDKVAVFTDREIFGSVFLHQRKQSTQNSDRLLRQFEGEISVGDYLVHQDYGIALYSGLTQESFDGQMREYLSLKFAGDDVLLVPIEQIGKLTKYIGNDINVPKLSRLGKGDWERVQGKVERAVKIAAKELISHYARRELATAPTIQADDSEAYNKFVDKFAYTETPDQIKSVNEIIFDLQKPTPMNRLLIGDVGFGKTEVIMRAAFKIAEAGLQVAVLCPTTVLCAQHFAVFSERFKDTGFKVAYLSRFNTAKENTEIVNKLNAGEVQIVVGTHAILRSDLKFKQLGLLVVDEEQRFGVAQKEKIKKMNYGVHHLAVSATPIPRTLGMALANIQDISLITQAPKGRKPIDTEVQKLDWNKVVTAIDKEVSRGGQVYFVHNHVQDIQSLSARLDELMPQLRVTVAHGQLSPAELDKRITDFFQHKTDVLLCTTIIENGLDMPNVNTIIVHQAEQFGLAQLYQLRGRVGRSDRSAYCYLFYTGQKLSNEYQEEDKKPKLIPDYIKRLEAMAQAKELGAGFSIASRDLEIRGAGNLLGGEQHGHIMEVGYALYMQMLNQEVERLKSVKEAADIHSLL
ncbi:MAG: DEAD/DEAH box helicase [Candidatus Doudnabacteria bacterium]|nr:DEAD/DEAH box helicase [Candidatus Doudnabacteria bacterium]